MSTPARTGPIDGLARFALSALRSVLVRAERCLSRTGDEHDDLSRHPTPDGFERYDPSRGMPIEDLFYSRPRNRRLMSDHDRVYFEAHGGIEKLIRAHSRSRD